MKTLVTAGMIIVLLLFSVTLVAGCQEEPSPEPVPAPVIPEDNETETTPATPAPVPAPEPAPEPPALEPPTPDPDRLESVSINPVEVAIGESRQLEVVATDQHGNRMSELDIVWKVNSDEAGSITENGLFTAAEVAGTFNDAVRVEVRQADVIRTAMTTVAVTPGSLEQIIIAPDSAEIGIGMTQQFVVVGVDRYGNRIPDLVFSWSVESGQGTIDGAGLFTAVATSGDYADTVKVEATQGSVACSDTANVTVEPDRILFLSSGLMFASTTPDIQIIDADGKNMKSLTPKYETEEFTFSFSPDCRRIMYSTGDIDGGIMMMNNDGSGNLCLVENDVDTTVSCPDWSPDGTRIVFSSYNREKQESDLHVMDADGSNVTQLTFTANFDESEPAWSPDGKRIAFSSYSHIDKESNIYVMDVDGSNVIQLTDTTVIYQKNYYSAPDWSPDGTRIMAPNLRTDMYGETISLICVMNADGSDIIDLPTNARFPAWSPDSAQIFFECNGHLYVIDADGTNKHKLTSGLLLNGSSIDALAWSPDLSRIVAISGRYKIELHTESIGGQTVQVGVEVPSGDNMYIIDADGQNQVRLISSDTFSITSPYWVPRKIGVHVTEDSVIIP